MSSESLHRKFIHELIRELYQKNPECKYCGKITWLGKRPQYLKNKIHFNDVATIDHVKSITQCKSKKEWMRDNEFVLSCRGCNTKKGNKTVEEFKMEKVN